MVLSRDYVKLLNKEMKAYLTIQKSFKKQREFLEQNVRNLYLNNTLKISLEYNYLNNAYIHLYPEKSREDEYTEEPLDGFWRAMGVYDLIDEMAPIIAKSYEKGYKLSFRLYRKTLEENGFIYNKANPADYSEYWGNLNLSNYKGAISYTTKKDVIDILKEGIDNHTGREEIADKINMNNEKLFSLGRARAIAVTETHKAYEYGHLKPMKDLYSVGIPVKKKRLTCGDDKVRPEHSDCERLERVELNYIYPSVKVEIPPGGVNCRCTMLYHID